MTMTINGKSAQRTALVIGISVYTSLQKLDFCKNDGTEVYEVLSSIGFEISEKNKLVGEAKWEKIRDTIYDFFVNNINSPADTLLFYYSGYVVPDVYGEIYLASSDIDFDNPYKGGFSFEELTKVIQKCISPRVVIILDCCYRGSAMVTMNEKDSAKVGEYILDEKSRKLPVQGRYILSSNQTLQEAYALTTDQHSIFTYYLLEGLRGNTESIDSDGNVTPQSSSNTPKVAVHTASNTPKVAVHTASNTPKVAYASELYTFIRKWGSRCAQLPDGSCEVPTDNQFSDPVGIAVDSSGFVYVIDYFNHRVMKFTSDGTFVTTWGS